MPIAQIVKINESQRRSSLGGRARKYDSDAARVIAYRARKNVKAVTFNLSLQIIDRLAAFMRLRVDSKFPSETKSEVVERALMQFFRKR